MPMQLQLEGPDLPTLLRRVKTEAGTGARIVRAEKVRTGGVAGFFARERYEITVEVDEDAALRPAVAAVAIPAARQPGPVTAPPPTSLLDLADSVSDSERAAPQVSTAHVSSAPASAAQLPAEPEVSTESSRFAAVLASLRATTAPTEAPTPARTRRDSPKVPRQRSPQPPATVVLPAAEVEAAVTGRRRDDLDLGLPVPSAAELRTQVDTIVPVRATLPPTREAPVQKHLSSNGVLALAARKELELPTRPTRAVVAVRPRPRPAAVHPLTHLGLPGHLQPAESGAALYPALVQSLRALPKAPRMTNKAGSVIAVVGPLPEALEAATELARGMGLTATSVVLATSYRTLTHLPERQVLRDVDEAELRRAAMKRRRNATIIVVDAPFTAAGAAQARAYLKVLAPTTTWGAVDATRKAPDIAAFVRAVGGLDALALSAVDETADPATVLQLGIPVARLAGRPATPAAWAALLTSRLAA